MGPGWRHTTHAVLRGAKQGRAQEQGHQYQAGMQALLMFHIMILVLSVPWQGRERKDCTMMRTEGMEGDSSTHVIDRRWWRCAG